MGYFNYFIKCIIRKFVNLIFKPKMLITFLVLLCMLFVLQTTSRAEWTDTEKEDLQTKLFEITQTLDYQLQQLETLSNNTTNITSDVTVLRQTLTSIDVAVYDIIGRLQETNSSLDEINTQLSTILTDINTLNTNILNIYNKLDENQQELLAELEEDNQAVLEELNMIRDAINGSEEEQTSYTDLGEIKPTTEIVSNTYRLRGIKLNYEPRYTYTIKLYVSNSYALSMPISVFYSDNIISSGFNPEDYNFVQIGSVPSGSENYIINYQVPSSNPTYIYFTWGYRIEKIEVYRSIKGIVESLNDSNSLQQEQNQLQQQQNQLQQEQNDFLTKPNDDNDVSVDNFNNVDSNDITSAGLTGVFNNIYSSITSWNAKNINLPIPYTNKTITIPANYTENMLNSSGGGWIVNFIHAVYYFIVGRFMIYSITNIVNSIKSGSILNTDSKNNITTDML